MRNKLVALAVFVVAALALFLGRDGDEPHVSAVEPSAREDARGGSSDGPEQLVATEDAARPAEAAPERVTVESEPAAGVEAEVQAAAVPPTIIGRILLPGGAPAAGATARVHGWGANSERRLEFGEPEGWVDPEGVVDADGRLSLTFDPPRAYQFTLDVSAPGYAEASWRWHELLPGETTDVGTVTLAEAGTLEVRVVDAAGADVEVGWRVYADSPRGVSRASGQGRDTTRVSASTDPVTQVAVLEGVPVGQVTLQAYNRAANWINGPTVDVRAGGTIQASIEYRGPELATRIQVSTSCRPLYTFSNPRAGSLTLERGGQEVAVFERVRGSSQSWAVDGLEGGEYSIVLEDERFLPHRIDGVRPGGAKSIRMVGASSFVLDVFDAEGERVELYELRITFPESNSRPNEFVLSKKDEPAPAGGLFEGIVPGQPVTLFVDGGERGSGRVDLGTIVPGESRPVRVELGGDPVRVRVVRGRGSEPVEEVEVALFKGELDAKSPEARHAGLALAGGWGSHMPEVVGKGRTAGDGACDLLDPGVETLTAFARLGAAQVFAPVVDGQALLHFPGHGRVVCLLEGAPPGRLPAGTALMVAPVVATDAHSFVMQTRFGPGVPCVRDEGQTFVANEVPEGSHVLAWVMIEAEVPSSRSSSTTHPAQSHPLAELEVREGETTTVRASIAGLRPGAIEVAVTRDGAPLEGILVVASQVTTDPDPLQFGAGPRRAGTTDADGRATVQPLMPGEWTVSASSFDSNWVVSNPVALTVRSGDRLQSELHVVVAKATLTVMDRATGEPLRETNVYWSSDGMNSRARKTDGEGRLTLELGAGSYVFTTDPFSGLPGLESSGGEGVPVLWSPAGPDVERIELSAPAPITFPGDR